MRIQTFDVSEFGTKLSKSARLAVVGLTVAVATTAVSPSKAEAFGLGDVLTGLGSAIGNVTTVVSGGNKTIKDALDGGMLGAAAGAVINSKDRGKGAAWGGAAGAAAGVILGSLNDSRQPEQTTKDPRYSAPAPQADGQSRAKMTRTRKIVNGQVVEDTVTEVIHSEQVYDGYGAAPTGSSMPTAVDSTEAKYRPARGRSM